jgi:hypothetical protein
MRSNRRWPDGKPSRMQCDGVHSFLCSTALTAGRGKAAIVLRGRFAHSVQSSGKNGRGGETQTILAHELREVMLIDACSVLLSAVLFPFLPHISAVHSTPLQLLSTANMSQSTHTGDSERKKR